MDVDYGQLVGRRLSHVAFVVDLHELSPVGRWATGGRDGRRLERFAEMCQDLPDRPRIGNERDESDVATTPRMSARRIMNGRKAEGPDVRDPHAAWGGGGERSWLSACGSVC